ncbi:hypothetical protein AAFF_G00116380 [Aldrovandia affinis]|uniref:Uncharacterized protein n=1 Tax=Aldrovandia affinis TaxID=143900 RepID=A0AAD7T2N5_9TELE|nr:hypothetical protein AAFF_G00116380 [Aldrovandia affinis]
METIRRGDLGKLDVAEDWRSGCTQLFKHTDGSPRPFRGVQRLFRGAVNHDQGPPHENTLLVKGEKERTHMNISCAGVDHHTHCKLTCHSNAPGVNFIERALFSASV